MDSSTGLQCRQLEDKYGGALSLAQCTGSRAYEVRQYLYSLVVSGGFLTGSPHLPYL